MRSSYSKYDEFGRPPAEFPISAEHEKICGTAGTTPVRSAASSEHTKPAPEITGPGEYRYTPIKKKSKKSIKKMMYTIAAVYAMVASLGNTDADSPEPTVTTGTAVTESVDYSESFSSASSTESATFLAVPAAAFPSALPVSPKLCPTSLQVSRRSVLTGLPFSSSDSSPVARFAPSFTDLTMDFPNPANDLPSPFHTSFQLSLRPIS